MLRGDLNNNLHLASNLGLERPCWGCVVEFFFWGGGGWLRSKILSRFLKLSVASFIIWAITIIFWHLSRSEIDLYLIGFPVLGRGFWPAKILEFLPLTTS